MTKAFLCDHCNKFTNWNYHGMTTTNLSEKMDGVFTRREQFDYCDACTQYMRDLIRRAKV